MQDAAVGPEPGTLLWVYFPAQEQAEPSLALMVPGSAQHREHGPALWAQHSGQQDPGGMLLPSSSRLHSHTENCIQQHPRSSSGCGFAPPPPCSLHGCRLLILHIPSLGVHQLPPDLR